MTQEAPRVSENDLLPDAATHLNKAIEAGSYVTATFRSGSSLFRDFPVTKIGDDFVSLKADNGNELIYPRQLISGFTIHKKKGRYS